MNPLPVIPTPPAQRWKDFRLKCVPAIIFALAALTILFMWNKNLAPSSFVGEVESVQENVSSPQSGQIADLGVDEFQMIKAGEVVAQVITTDPKVVGASLGVVRAEIELLKTGMDPVLNQHRDAVNYEQLRLSWMAQRVDLASARIRLRYAESELERVTKLFHENAGIASEQQYDVATRDQKALQSEVDERAKLVADMEKRLDALKVPEQWANPQGASNPAIAAAIAVQDEKLHLCEVQLNPITLKAPQDGVVSKIFRRSGETVIAGDPIITITAPRTQRIIGYLRQPLPFEPKVGDSIEVYSRRPHRQAMMAKILQVGGQMELVSSPLRLRGYAPGMERGLPVLLNLPAELNLHPGELVDLTFRPSR